MQRIITLLLASISLTAYAQESAQSDSLSKPVYYPELTLPAGDMGSVVQSYRFEEAKANLEKQMTQLKRRRKDTSALEAQLEICNKGIRGLSGTDKIVILDSLVLSKDKFLDGYTNMHDLGTITLSADGKTTSYTTELGNKMYEPVSILTDEGEPSSTFKCYYLENGAKVSSTILDGLEIDGELNYPFLMSDGVTFYFAARTTEGYGNYDLYVTRFDSEDDKFYRAENMGFPFSSYANDYMIVIDEANGIGWFASDRYQPEGKVCIYSFLYTPSRHPFDYENDDHKEIISYASLRSIKATWSPDNEYERIKARQRLSLSQTSTSSKQKSDFTFVINDNFTYTSLKDFHSEEAKTMFTEWQKATKALASDKSRLAKLRNDYAEASSLGKDSMKETILKLEAKVEQETKRCHEMEKEIRRAENQ